jgi:hypothetical protein
VDTHALIEKYQLHLFLADLGIAAVGFLWLVVKAFGVRWTWGLAVLLLPPLALVFAYARSSCCCWARPWPRPPPSTRASSPST